MGEQGTFQLLLRFSVPAVVGMMVQALYNFVDRIYIGRAVGKAKISMFLVLTRSVILQVPCILILPHFFGLDGIWVSTPISTLGSSLITGAFLYYILRQLKDN